MSSLRRISSSSISRSRTFNRISDTITMALPLFSKTSRKRKSFTTRRSQILPLSMYQILRASRSLSSHWKSSMMPMKMRRRMIGISLPSMMRMYSFPRTHLSHSLPILRRLLGNIPKLSSSLRLI